MSPRLTVLMPVFNREQFVDEAIQSVIDQDFADYELLIVDDGSTDGTPELLRGWARKDARIRVVTTPQNLGVTTALNLGIQEARTDYVARHDSDDIMTPGRLAAQVAALEDDPALVLVSCAYELMDQDGHYLGTWHEEHPHEVMVYLLNFYNIVGGGGHVMFRRSEVVALGGYDGAFPASEDYELWTRLLRRGRILVLPLVGMKQRQHQARITVHHASAKRAYWTAIMSRSLGPYLGRPIRDEEIGALITVWRFNGILGMSQAADATMREAFARFCRDHADPDLRRRVRNRTARQWIDGARFLSRGGHRAEAGRYLLRAARWSPASVVRALASPRIASLKIALSKLLRAMKRRIDGAPRPAA